VNPLLGSVIAAHGGLDRWSTVRAIDVTFNFSGGLLDLKAIWWSASDLEHRRDSTRIPKKDRSLAVRVDDDPHDRAACHRLRPPPSNASYSASS